MANGGVKGIVTEELLRHMLSLVQSNIEASRLGEGFKILGYHITAAGLEPMLSACSYAFFNRVWYMNKNLLGNVLVE